MKCQQLRQHIQNGINTHAVITASFSSILPLSEAETRRAGDGPQKRVSLCGVLMNNKMASEGPSNTLLRHLLALF